MSRPGKRVVLDYELSTFLEITVDFIGKPIKSDFSLMYETYASELPNNAGEVDIYVDPTGSVSRLDLKANYDIDKYGNITNIVRHYSIQPDVWMGEVALYDRNIKDLYADDLYNNELLGEKPYFIILRRLGDPSIGYCIENKLDNVYIASLFLSKAYYKTLIDNYDYLTLHTKLLKPGYVDANWQKFNILDK